MGQILHGCATTTLAVRRAIQHSQASLRTLAARYGVNQKTVAKWKRSSIADLPTGSKDVKSIVLSIDDEAIVVAFRRHTLLPLDDCLYVLQANAAAADALFIASLPATPWHLTPTRFRRPYGLRRSSDFQTS